MMKNRFIFFPLCIAIFYLTACSEFTSDTLISEPIPDLGSTGGKVFKEFCSACHGLPSPKVHKAKEWPNVIERMQMHRIKKAYLPLSDTEKKELINYLQEHAAS